MAKEKTILINLRVPESLLKDFDSLIEETVYISSRTAGIIALMKYALIQKKKKKEIL